ncbi:MAG: flagellar biosynthetic protein FliR [Pirellulales bacterium]
MPWLDPVTGFLIALRVSGVLALAPGWSSRVLPLRIRALGVVLLTLVLLPTQQGRVPPGVGWHLSILGVRELCLGLALGMAVRMIVAAVQWSGQVIGNSLGWQSPSFLPDGEAGAAPLERLLALTATAIYFAVGGQRQLVGALLESFVRFPLGESEIPAVLGTALPEILMQGTSWSLRIAAPPLVALFAATLVAGLLQRALPQLEMLSWFGSAQTLLALALLTLSLGSLSAVFSQELASVWEVFRGPSTVPALP